MLCRKAALPPLSVPLSQCELLSNVSVVTNSSLVAQNLGC